MEAMVGQAQRIGMDLGTGWRWDYRNLRDCDIDKADVKSELVKRGREDSV